MSAPTHGPRWQGRPRQYQSEAQTRYAIAHDSVVLPWSWIRTDCDVPMCLNVECMTIHKPTRLPYWADICIYCGDPGYTRDHLLPEPLTGRALRTMVLTVPACRGCNSTIGDLPTAHVGERRRTAQLAIERRHKRLLLCSDKVEADLVELGPSLRTVARQNNLRRARIRAQLAWPPDPFYDLRPFQRAGIEDPESLGLCDALATPLRPEYQEAA